MRLAWLKAREVNWRAWFGPRGSGWLPLLVYALIPLLTGYVVISRAFEGDGYLPIDSGDEPAETFVQLPMALGQLARGDLPKINLFNNFGTPILGEPVVYPFALHAWSYAVWRPTVAMLVNKFVLAALSMVILTLFFARYFPPLISSFCAFLTFSSPAFFYFFQNHPHQGVLFYYGLILVAWRRFFDRPNGARGFCLYAAFLAFFLSVGINGALLGTGFILAYAVLLARGRGRAKERTTPLCESDVPREETRTTELRAPSPAVANASLVCGLGLWLAAFVAVHPHFLEFFRLAAASARKDLDYQRLTVVPPLDFVVSLFFPFKQNSGAAVYYSLPVMGFIIGGLAFAVSKARREWRSGAMESWSEGQEAAPQQSNTPTLQQSSNPLPRHFSELCRLLFVLGVAPCVAVIFFRLFPDLAAAVPVVKSLNITRLLWFSDVFLLLGAGLAANAVWQRAAHARLALRVLWTSLLVITVLVRFSTFRAQARFFSVTESYTQFQPAEFLERIKPGTRLATLADPFPLSHDTKANSHGILGSAGRSIILDKAFRDDLRRRKLIELGFNGMTYFFVPAPPDALARFGIRYCLSPLRDQQLEDWGWKPILALMDVSGEATCVLYQNPSEATPVYIAGPKPEFLQRYHIGGNEIAAELPPRTSAYEVVATFLARPGWKAFINGQPVPVRASEDHFIQVEAGPGRDWQRLRLKYEPYSNAYLIGCFILSLGGAGLLCWVLKRAGQH